MSDTKKYPAGTHPNSLKNLQGPWNSETAKEAQLKGAKQRSLNAALRRELKMNMEMWKSMQEELSESKSDSVEILRMLAFKKLNEGDDDGAAELFKSIAEFEKPKLQRVETKTEEVKADEMTDEELMKRLQELARKAD